MFLRWSWFPIVFFGDIFVLAFLRVANNRDNPLDVRERFYRRAAWVLRRGGWLRAGWAVYLISLRKVGAHYEAVTFRRACQSFYTELKYTGNRLL